MMDTYGIARNLALTGAIGYPKVSELGSIYNKDVSAMLKLVSSLPPGMDGLIRAERDRFAVMKKALGGIAECGVGLPKLYASITELSAGQALIKDLVTTRRDRQHDWNVVPPPPAPIRVDMTINFVSKPPD
jgi:hypothetical protein